MGDRPPPPELPQPPLAGGPPCAGGRGPTLSVAAFPGCEPAALFPRAQAPTLAVHTPSRKALRVLRNMDLMSRSIFPVRKNRRGWRVDPAMWLLSEASRAGPLRWGDPAVVARGDPPGSTALGAVCSPKAAPVQRRAGCRAPVWCLSLGRRVCVEGAQFSMFAGDATGQQLRAQTLTSGSRGLHLDFHASGLRGFGRVSPSFPFLHFKNRVIMMASQVSFASECFKG